MQSYLKTVAFRREIDEVQKVLLEVDLEECKVQG